MKQLQAYSISIGILGAIDTYLTATILPVPVWVTFIAWASFFIVGGKLAGLKRSVVSNLAGVLIASCTLLIISVMGGSPLIAAICVGIGSAAMVQASKIPLLSILPAIVWGFASTVSTMVATDVPMTSLGWNNPGLVAAAGVIVGGLFGYVSEIWGDSMTKKQTVPTPAASHSSGSV
ncbi:DUF1097 domain-containing protein [Paenibacillus abyssi]|uniref:DUF1097 domain-containing protein n=1 Tax=Paenibacillus abyssi TaxID=1340531 RepID=A0A917LH13_9BACL|nr:DUF1097 domain-containing protein [Paenibacillus abyssi]GGG22470.1 hypothetical protein GCM10010916_43900 [Paenibacillus abyssi]